VLVPGDKEAQGCVRLASPDCRQEPQVGPPLRIPSGAREPPEAPGCAARRDACPKGDDRCEGEEGKAGEEDGRVSEWREETAADRDLDRIELRGLDLLARRVPVLNADRRQSVVARPLEDVGNGIPTLPAPARITEDRMLGIDPETALALRLHQRRKEDCRISLDPRGDDSLERTAGP